MSKQSAVLSSGRGGDLRPNEIWAVSTHHFGSVGRLIFVIVLLCLSGSELAVEISADTEENVSARLIVEMSRLMCDSV